MLNSIVMAAQKSFSWGNTTQQNHLTCTQLYSGCCSYQPKSDRAQSGMHSHPRLEASLRNSRGKSPRSAIEQNLCRLLRSVSCMSLSTQLLALVHLLSRCYAPAAYPECRHQNTTAISRTIGAHAPAVIPGQLP